MSHIFYLNDCSLRQVTFSVFEKNFKTAHQQFIDQRKDPYILGKKIPIDILFISQLSSVIGNICCYRYCVQLSVFPNCMKT